MVALSRHDRSTIVDLRRALSVWDGKEGGGLRLFGGVVHELLGFDKSFGYTLVEQPDGIRAHIPWLTHMLKDSEECFNQFLHGTQVNWSVYNPLRPEPNQRNVFLDATALERIAPDVRRTPLIALYPKLRLSYDEQLRALVCEGDSFLAWVGGFRAERYDARDLSVLSSLLPTLRTRLSLERKLENANLASAALRVAFDAISAPVFLVDADQRVVLMNQLAAWRFEQQSSALRERLRSCVTSSPPPGCTVTPVQATGMKPHFLVIMRESPNLDSLIARATVAWSLTESQRGVLTRVASGEANKTIAAHLRKSVKTIELHIKGLFEKSGAENRASLIVRLWSLAT